MTSMVVPVSLQREATSPPVDDRYAGVRALWIKVIIRAVFDWVAYRDSARLFQRKLAESAHTWLFRPSELFNSFENVCHMLDIDPEKVRRWAKTMSKDQVAKIEHLERYPSAGRDVSPALLSMVDDMLTEEEESEELLCF
jgi:hypothetical protein